jgi:hypothetical protein
LSGNFPDKEFKLKNVQKKWEGKTFDELNPEDQFKLLNSTMRAYIILPITNEKLKYSDPYDICDLFFRYNPKLIARKSTKRL